LHGLLAEKLGSSDISYGQGTVDAFDEASLLLISLLRIPLHALAEWEGREVGSAERERAMRIASERVRRRKPMAYIMNEVIQQNEVFYVDERTIVPRSFIGDILANTNEMMPEAGDCAAGGVLDMCTGSGCLAILAAKHFPAAGRVHAVDISADALAVAHQNVNMRGLGKAVRLYSGNVFKDWKAYPAGGNARRAASEPVDSPLQSPYDLIICNPPYVDNKGMRNLPMEYRFEPEVSLWGGSDGLSIIRRVLAGAQRHLSEDGALLLEVGRSQGRLWKEFPNLMRKARKLRTEGMDPEADPEVILLRKRDL
jgi:ribosomal protein L3 glutamine methyltransferase